MPAENPFSVNTFRTSNRQLAFALATAGCSFAPAEAGGPALNIYTFETLRERKVGLGLPLERAAQQAFERKIPGNVTYIFSRSEKLDRCIKAWDSAVKTFQIAAAEGREPIFLLVSEEAIMQTLCVHANNVKAFAELPFFRDALVMTGSQSSSEDQNKTTIKGSAKIWSLGASLKLKNDLKKK